MLKNSEKNGVTGGKILFVGGFAPQGRLHPQAPDTFGLNSPSQLIIGFYWLAFLKNQVRKNLMSQKFKINILLNELLIIFAYISEHCASFGTKKKLATFLSAL